MLVTNFNPETREHESVIRATHKIQLVLNGSFIDIHWEQDGKRNWIGVDSQHLRSILKKRKHGSSIVAIAQYDEEVS